MQSWVATRFCGAVCGVVYCTVDGVAALGVGSGTLRFQSSSAECLRYLALLLLPACCASSSSLRDPVSWSPSAPIMPGGALSSLSASALWWRL